MCVGSTKRSRNHHPQTPTLGTPRPHTQTFHVDLRPQTSDLRPHTSDQWPWHANPTAGCHRVHVPQNALSDGTVGCISIKHRFDLGMCPLPTSLCERWRGFFQCTNGILDAPGHLARPSASTSSAGLLLGGPCSPHMPVISPQCCSSIPDLTRISVSPSLRGPASFSLATYPENSGRLVPVQRRPTRTTLAPTPTSAFSH